MAHRSDDLQTFLDTLHVSLIAAAPPKSPEALAVAKAFDLLQTPGEQLTPNRETPSACEHLPAAFANAASSNAKILAAAFQAIEPRLCWRPRPDRNASDPGFAHLHATALVAGDNGLEAQSNVRIGVSLMAPETQYPDHNHPPEEVYVALSDGMWRQDANPWHEPGPGGLVYNHPHVTHSMLSGPAPLLAIWTLPID
jgi:quercetin dioxygenase-like cupin family protein